MSDLMEYAKEELNRIGMIDSGEPYNYGVSKAILDLIELFSSQGHSGFTASYTISTFSRLAMFKPLTPLTGEDDEWKEIRPGEFQNKRYSAVFKDEKGEAYNIDGKVFTDDGGKTWYGNKYSRVYITFPYTVPDKPEYVYLDKTEKEDVLCMTKEGETTTQEDLLQTLYELESENERLHDAFDKIVAEVQSLPKTYPFYNHIDTYVKDDDVVKIINKYKDRKECGHDNNRNST